MLSARYLFIKITFFLFTTSLSKQEITCGPLNDFLLEVESDKKVYVYDADINIKYERNDLAVYEYSDTNAVNILINNTEVYFAGHILERNQDYDPTALKVSRILNTQIAGSARLMQSLYNGYTLSDCDLYLARNLKDNYDLPTRIHVEILHQAALCVKEELCKRLGEIALEDLKNGSSHPYDFGPLVAITEKSDKCDSSINQEKTMYKKKLKKIVSSIRRINVNDAYREGLQSTLNMLVDLAIAGIIKKIRKQNQGFVKMPDLDFEGIFNITNGTFWDLTTLSRTEDAILSHSDLKFIASCGFGLSKAKVQYEMYEAKYSFIHLSGELIVSINGIAMTLTIAVDYNHKPCRAIVQDLQITRIGKFKIRLSGMGPLNAMYSKIVTWISNKWRDMIISNIQQMMREILERELDKFNCEKYRP